MCARSLRGNHRPAPEIAELGADHGLPLDVAAVQARYVDLVILGQLDPGNAQASVDCPPPEDIGRPALVVPDVSAYAATGRHALVDWNASRQASRAIGGDALPLFADLVGHGADG